MSSTKPKPTPSLKHFGLAASTNMPCFYLEIATPEGKAYLHPFTSEDGQCGYSINKKFVGSAVWSYAEAKRFKAEVLEDNPNATIKRIKKPKWENQNAGRKFKFFR